MRACCILAPVVAVLFPEAFTSGRTRVQTVTVRYCGEALAGQVADLVQAPRSRNNWRSALGLLGWQEDNYSTAA